MISLFALILYLFLLAVFVGGVIVIVYHLLTFRLNKSLALFMISLLLVGGGILLVMNIFYFVSIDWNHLLSNTWY